MNLQTQKLSLLGTRLSQRRTQRLSEPHMWFNIERPGMSTTTPPKIIKNDEGRLVKTPWQKETIRIDYAETLKRFFVEDAGQITFRVALMTILVWLNSTYWKSFVRLSSSPSRLQSFHKSFLWTLLKRVYSRYYKKKALEQEQKRLWAVLYVLVNSDQQQELLEGLHASFVGYIVLEPEHKRHTPLIYTRNWFQTSIPFDVCMTSMSYVSKSDLYESQLHRDWNYESSYSQTFGNLMIVPDILSGYPLWINPMTNDWGRKSETSSVNDFMIINTQASVQYDSGQNDEMDTQRAVVVAEGLKIDGTWD